MSKKALNLVLTIRDDIDSNNIYSNGISQNIIFFYDLFELLGHNVTLMIVTKRDKKFIRFKKDKKYKIRTIDEVIQKHGDIDILFEVGNIVGDVIRKKVTDKGGKILHVLCGNQLIMDMELLFYDDGKDAGFRHMYNDIDHVWIIPQHTHQKSYIEVMSNAEVNVCPCIWEPDFVTLESKTHLQFRETPNIYVMEPNLSVLKNCLIPVAIIEALHRKNPTSFNQAFIVNGQVVNNHPYFLNNIVSNFHASNAFRYSDKVFYTPRASFTEVFTHYDVLLSHHWKNPLNYLSFEALYHNIPFVHNSELMKDVGYYYPEFEVHDGARAVEDALLNYKATFKEHVKRNQTYVESLSIHNTSVQETYKSLIAKALN